MVLYTFHYKTENAKRKRKTIPLQNKLFSLVFISIHLFHHPFNGLFLTFHYVLDTAQVPENNQQKDIQKPISCEIYIPVNGNQRNIHVYDRVCQMMISYLKIKLERIERVRGGYRKLSPCYREMYALDFWTYGMTWNPIMIRILLRDITALASVSQMVGCHRMH